VKRCSEKVEVVGLITRCPLASRIHLKEINVLLLSNGGKVTKMKDVRRNICKILGVQES
jgi:hypothetical protein